VTIALALALLVLAGPARAHGGEAHIWDYAATWTSDLRVIIPLYATAILYLIGTRRVWARAGTGRGVRYRQAFCFWAGWVVLALALLSPLHWLAERLFTAHMVEHEIIMAIAAPLLVLARPGGAILWALPAAWRVRLGGAAKSPAIAWTWRWHTDPLVATILHGVAIWAWHVPALFEAAVANAFLHWLQHLSFLITGLLFWWALFFGRARGRGFGAAAVYLFATATHTGFLGVLLTLSKTSWYPVQTAFAAEWGLTPLEDQQLAGLVMWVPAGMIYAGAALALVGLWIARSSRGTREEAVLARPAV
jgi:putative membrane protein